MHIGIITTTIQIPYLLIHFPVDRTNHDVSVFIAGDLNSPHEDIENFLYGLHKGFEKVRYIWPKEQEQWSVSEHIGWRTIQRRNIATLEAIQSGADVLYFWDDDNKPNSRFFDNIADWFGDEKQILSWPMAIWNHRWFNIGQYGRQDYYARGYPYSLRDKPAGAQPAYQFIKGQPLNTGVVSGLITGDPDINATQRMEIQPNVTSYDDMAVNGIVIDPSHTWGPINSQNTAYRRELAPLFALCPSIGRYDDIMAGWVAQRVMGEHGYHVVYGPPIVHQDRNPHNLLNDLEQELWGMKHTEAFCEFLEGVPLLGKSIMNDLYTIVSELSQVDDFPWPVNAQRFYDAWLKDVEKAMN